MRKTGLGYALAVVVAMLLGAGAGAAEETWNHVPPISISADRFHDFQPGGFDGKKITTDRSRLRIGIGQGLAYEFQLSYGSIGGAATAAHIESKRRSYTVIPVRYKGWEAGLDYSIRATEPSPFYYAGRPRNLHRARARSITWSVRGPEVWRGIRPEVFVLDMNGYVFRPQWQVNPPPRNRLEAKAWGLRLSRETDRCRAELVWAAEDAKTIHWSNISGYGARPFDEKTFFNFNLDYRVWKGLRLGLGFEYLPDGVTMAMGEMSDFGMATAVTYQAAKASIPGSDIYDFYEKARPMYENAIGAVTLGLSYHITF